jgi:hypothetical protein
MINLVEAPFPNIRKDECKIILNVQREHGEHLGAGEPPPSIFYRWGGCGVSGQDMVGYSTQVYMVDTPLTW